MAKPMLSSGEVTTILGEGAAFEGKMTFKGEVRVAGRFSGEVQSESRLVVATGALMEAEIHIGTIVVEGTIKGNIRAKQLVELNAPARVYGDIFTPKLIVHEGAIFEGRCTMENLEKRLAPAAIPAVEVKAEAKK